MASDIGNTSPRDVMKFTGIIWNQKWKLELLFFKLCTRYVRSPFILFLIIIKDDPSNYFFS